MRICDINGSIYSSNNIIIEVKTTSIKQRERFKLFGPQESYLLQANYYCYLFGAKRFQFAYYFLDEDDYEGIKKGKFVFDEEKVSLTGEIEADFEELEKVIDRVKDIRGRIINDENISINKLYGSLKSSYALEDFKNSKLFLEAEDQTESLKALYKIYLREKGYDV